MLDRDAADSQVTSFLTAADGVHELDSSDLDLEQTVQAVLDLVRRRPGRARRRLGRRAPGGAPAGAARPTDGRPADEQARTRTVDLTDRRDRAARTVPGQA